VSQTDNDAWAAIFFDIEQKSGSKLERPHCRSVGGGSINSAWIVDSGELQYFVKTNRADRLEMFIAESEGLNEMIESQNGNHPDRLHIPAPVCVGVAGHSSYIAMEYLAVGSGNSNSMVQLGRALARMHRQSQTQFGWHRDNTIGSTPQPNNRESSWIEFYRQHRLGFQLELAGKNGADRRTLERGLRLSEDLDGFFQQYQPMASLLHGDLWSGNYAILTSGDPAIFDPAVYYGDREADLAMTELFGGFSRDFYSAYNEAWPIDTGYKTRKNLYNLYHILNHFNLFGGGYLGQATHTIDSLLAELN